jgi:hypothetical protein
VLHSGEYVVAALSVTAPIALKNRDVVVFSVSPMSAAVRIYPAIIALALLLPSYAHAFIYCNEPKEPYCLDNEFDDEGDFSSCKWEMESYRRNVKNYTSCLSDAADEALKKYNKAVERFNCRARRETYCY